MIQKFRHLTARLKARIPEDLPRGMSELDAFIQSTLSTYGLPNNPSYHRTIATLIQHLPQSCHKAPKIYFYKAIKRAEAMECAYWKLQNLKEEEKAKAEAKAKELAATPSQEPLIDGIEAAERPSG